MMAPLSVLDYIVVHELAHRLHRNHNAAFWDAVDKVLPDYQKQVSWLKHNGEGMML
nr:M48 family metallopeptidase [Aeromonas hydrophila]